MSTALLSPVAIELRDYQQLQVKRVLAARKRGKKAALVISATGTGKTITLVEITRLLRVKTVVLAHREQLLEQTRQKMLLVNPQADIGIVGFGYEEWGHDILLCGVQSLRFPERLAQLEQEHVLLFICDEVHHDSGDNSYALVRAACPDAFLVGFTATADRMDEKPIEAVYGQPVFERHITRFIRDGWLCDLKCHMVRSERTSLDGVRLNRDGTDYHGGELERAINRRDRNTVIVRETMAVGDPFDPTLAFCSSVQHARDLCATFLDAGVIAACVFGDTPKDEREVTEQDFSTGQVTVLCNVDVYGEGSDMDVRRIVMAAPTRSRARYAQIIGRGTRLAPGKTVCWIIDVTDNSSLHTLDPIRLADVLDLPELQPEQSAKEADTLHRERTGKNPEDDDGSTAVKDGDTSGRIVTKKVSLGPIAWRRLRSGGYEAQADLHRIVIWPKKAGTFDVGVFLKDTVLEKPKGHILLKSVPLGWAQMYAEQQTRKLQAGDRHLVDPNASWRSNPASEKQVALLKKFHLPTPRACTSGQASELLDAFFAKKKASSYRKKKHA